MTTPDTLNWNLEGSSPVKKTGVLILASSPLSQKSLRELLCGRGYEVHTATSREQALTVLADDPRSIILVDADRDSIEIVKHIRKKSSQTPFVVLSAAGDAAAAVDIMKLGAVDCLIKPVDDKQVLAALEHAGRETPAGMKQKQTAKPELRREDAYYGLIGTSARMQHLYSLIERIANTKATILIRGESGTGKRLIAHAIHLADRKRCEQRFIEVPCGALPREIIESELFGHTRGAFTSAITDRKGRFELADGGTILLDDIDTFPLEIQVKLLRVLQQKEFERVGDHRTMKVDARVVASTNQNLEKLITDGKFREDLYYRLNVIALHVPPLRERKEDLPLLLEHFVRLFAQDNHKTIQGISAGAREILLAYQWPGNVRELENIIERAVILDVDGVIDVADLPEALCQKDVEIGPDRAVLEGVDLSSLKDALREPEKGHILKVLQDVGWNKKKAAVKLGVNRTTLYNKLRQYNISASVDDTKEKD